jgi:apolipoprotein N-acyltransferase
VTQSPSRIASAAHRLAGLRTMQRNAAAFLCGAASMLAFAPFGAWPVLWLTLPALMWLTEGAEADARGTPRFAPWRRVAAGRSAEVGWWFGFGYHLAGLYWIGAAFLVEAEVFAWLMPLAVTILPAGLGLFFALASAVTTLSRVRKIPRAIAFATMLAMAEWLRGHVLTGLPWNALGYALANELVLMQIGSLVGLWGLTLIASLVFCVPAEILRRAPGGIGGRPQQLAALGLAMLPLVLMAVFGAARLASAPQADTAAPRVRIVQPSILQREKWQRQHQRRIFDEHLALSRTAPDGKTDDAAGIAMIVWPEAAMPFLPLQEPVALAEIGAMLPPHVTLLSGGLRLEADGASRRVFNSVFAFAHGEPARVLDIYDKVHLVPFGEYVPLRSFIAAIGLEPLIRFTGGGFATGPERAATMEIPAIGRVGVSICYEAIFPGTLIDQRRRPVAMVNVTNDGWFGNTSGPRQHLQQARLRAVEEGLPLLRAANNGISTVIDTRGRVVAMAPLDARGVIDARLPAAAPPTVYGQLRDVPFWIAITLLLVIIAAGRRRSSDV